MSDDIKRILANLEFIVDRIERIENRLHIIEDAENLRKPFGPILKNNWNNNQLELDFEIKQ